MRIIGVIKAAAALVADWHRKQAWLKACRRHLWNHGYTWVDANHAAQALYNPHRDPIEAARDEMDCAIQDMP